MKLAVNRVEILIVFLFLSYAGFPQLKQIVRGKVIDKVTTAPLPGVNIILNDVNLGIGATTNSNGEFEIKGVPVGRNKFTFRFVGYEPVFLQNIAVNSGKELFLEVEMVENVTELGQVEVVAFKKGEVINKMATISAQSFTIEEAEHYAGSWSDPARMATNFAGVLTSSNDTRNDIIIRGNSPTGLLWRLEGVDIPNPNHFAVQGTSGGPVSMLNSNLLSRSDFFTGAFPAQYGNALGGVFDLNLRNGNNKKNEYMFQAGLNGYEAGLEGPLFGKNKASYMVNYRYSFLDVLKNLGFKIAGGAVPTYSDLNYKIFIPTGTIGSFSVFGLMGWDNVSVGAENSTDQFNPIDNTDLKNRTLTGIYGLTYKLLSGDNGNLRTSVSYSRQSTHISLDSIMPDLHKQLYYSSNFTENTFLLNMHYTYKANSRNTISTGISYREKSIDQVDSVLYMGKYIDLMNLDNEYLQLFHYFLEWKHRFSNKTELYTGILHQYLFMNQTKTIEPRIGFNWNITATQALKFGYGIHSQMQSLPVYFVETSNPECSEYWNTCEDLDFSKSQHYILGYTNKLGKQLNFKIESYYQDLWNIPIENKPNSFSVLNLGATYYNGTQDRDSLVNKGLGKNYGIEMTLEKYLDHKWYFLVTSSLFKSLYKPGDGIWRNTVFSSNYATNALIGFEFPINKSSSLDFNLRFIWSGGIRSLEVDKDASLAAGVVIYDESKAYSKRNRDYMKMDFKMTFKYNFKKATLEVGGDIANLTDRDNIFSESFNPKTGLTSFTYQQGFLPTGLIRLSF